MKEPYVWKITSVTLNKVNFSTEYAWPWLAHHSADTLQPHQHHASPTPTPHCHTTPHYAYASHHQLRLTVWCRVSIEALPAPCWRQVFVSGRVLLDKVLKLLNWDKLYHIHADYLYTSLTTHQVRLVCALTEEFVHEVLLRVGFVKVVHFRARIRVVNKYFIDIRKRWFFLHRLLRFIHVLEQLTKQVNKIIIIRFQSH